MEAKAPPAGIPAPGLPPQRGDADWPGIPPIPALGRTLRKLRVERRLSLEDVARETGLSASFLSLLENDKSDVSLARLHRIARFYNLNIPDLFALQPITARRIVPLSEAPAVLSPGEGFQMRLLSEDPERTMEPFHMTLQPGARYREPLIHEGEEFVHLLQGSVRLLLGEESFDLKPGQTAYYPSTIPHALENIGPRPAALLGCSYRRNLATRI
jgi:transcriptional regulator with XRE-family HTH domain